MSEIRVCVVGGGPAGLAAAIALRSEHCEVTVIDCGHPPVDKACGEGLMPDCVAALAELGVDIPAGPGFPFRGIRFTDGASSVSADFPEGHGRGIRRTVLHRMLCDRAADLGVSAIWNAKHVQLSGPGVTLDGRSIDADLVVGADGLNSAIRRQAALGEIAREKQRYAFRRHYRIAPWSPYMELYWGTNAQLYITPTAGDEVCVVAASRYPQLRLEQVLGEFPELSDRLQNAAPVSRELGALTVSRSLRRVQRGNVVLIGDASGSVDAITGEGICLGVKQALALRFAIKSGDIRAYGRLHKKLMHRPQTMASLMLSLERKSHLQRRVLAGFAQHPEIFQSLLSVHVGASSFRHLCSWRLIDFGRALLAA